MPTDTTNRIERFERTNVRTSRIARRNVPIIATSAPREVEQNMAPEISRVTPTSNTWEGRMYFRCSRRLLTGISGEEGVCFGMSRALRFRGRLEGTGRLFRGPGRDGHRHSARQAGRRPRLAGGHERPHGADRQVYRYRRGLCRAGATDPVPVVVRIHQCPITERTCHERTHRR